MNNIPLRLCSFNANGLADSKKRRDIFTWLVSKDNDICFLQETHFTSKLESYIQAEWGYKIYCASYSGNSRGVAILFRNTFPYTIHQSISDPEGRFIILSVTIRGEKLILVNLYGPNEDKPEFFKCVQSKIDSLSGVSVIIGGDFNVVQDYNLDTMNLSNKNNVRSHEQVLSMQSDLDLIDPWRVNNPSSNMFTWHSRNKYSRLDYFLISSDLQDYVQNPCIKPGYRSDHSVVEISICLPDQCKGPGLWKFNNSLLRDPDYVRVIKRCINDTLLQYAAAPYNFESPLSDVHLTIDDSLFFEVLKLEIRGKTIAYSAAKKKEINQQENILQERIDSCFTALSADPSNDKEQNLEDALNELKILRETKVEGVMARAKARWHLHGERNSKYFCNLENRHYREKTMCSILNKNGEVISDPISILEEQKQFYSSVYGSSPTQFTEVHEKLFFPTESDLITKLDEESRENLDRDITSEECLQVLKNMKNGKSPGSSGFTVEFYKFFWSDLNPLIIRSFNAALENDSLSITQKQGIITCIPKPGKDKLLLKNWRPISLLNVDYKILSGVLAMRMKGSLDSLISPHQKGFMKGRYIGECTRLIYDLIYELEKRKHPGLIILLDFKRAFDTLQHSFIEKVLKYFNFGDSFRKWISILYNECESRVIQNGYLSESFKVQRGVRQGDPLSPYLFILSVQLLTAAMLDHLHIKGVNINDSEYLISQYADDTDLFLDNDKKSFETVFWLLDKFGECSGLKLNFDKTVVVRIGIGDETVYCENLNLKWQSRGVFTSLGIKFDLDKDDITADNYKLKTKEFKSVLNAWTARNLTVYGRVTIIKSLALSKLVHLFTALPDPPENMLKELQRLCFEFIWSKKRDKIKRTTMFHEYSMGGFNVPNIELFCKSLKLSWVQRLVNNTGFSPWIVLLCDSISEFGGHYIWHGNDINHLLIRAMNPFWSDVYHAWVNLTTKKQQGELGIAEIMNQPLFFNKDIRVRGKSFVYKNWINSEVKYVYDLVDEEGSFLCWNQLSAFFIDKTLVNFLQYQSLVNAIPRNWKKRIKDERSNVEEFASQENIIMAKTVSKIGRFYYKRCLDAIATKPEKIQSKWERILHVDTGAEEIDWSFIYMIPYQCTMETKLRYFQLKIIHRILPTNYLLRKYGITGSARCTFCNHYDETLEHLFYECHHSKTLWLQLAEWLRERGEHFDPSPSVVLLGNYTVSRLMQHIILITKEYIFSCKQKATLPLVRSLLRFIKFKYSIEKHYKLIGFVKKKWGHLENSLEDL